MPSKYKDNPIEICICFGGNLKEKIRQNVSGYEEKYTTEKLTFSEWGGDALTQYIDKYFLNESLLPKNFHSTLRKSLALIDEPNISFKHFAKLINMLSDVKHKTNKEKIKTFRQLRISLGILIAWCQKAGNLESAYLSAELSVLHSWEFTKPFLEKKTKDATSIIDVMDSIILAYLALSNEFTNKILPHVTKQYAISYAVGATNKVDVNLKLFDLLGRIAINGIWSYWQLLITPKEDVDSIQVFKHDIEQKQISIIQLIDSNPILFTPYKDEQTIDISIAIYFLMLDFANHNYIHSFLYSMDNNIVFNFGRGSHYPSTLNQYNDLIEHPIKTTKEYKESITEASILYPYMAMFSAVLGFDDIYKNIHKFTENNMQHCSMQLWYPNESSEDNFYTNANTHGTTFLSKVFIDKDKKEFLEQIFRECKTMSFLQDMSAIKCGFEPIIFLGCRHYRLPIPIHFFSDNKPTKIKKTNSNN